MAKKRNVNVLNGSASFISDKSIKIINETEFWITSEDEGSGHPTLFKIVVR